MAKSIARGAPSASTAADNDMFTIHTRIFVQATAIKAAHLADEQRPIETLWDVATGATAYARGISFQDERVAIEREAGKIIDLAK